MKLIENIFEEMIKNKCGEIFYLDTHLEIICSYCLKKFKHISNFCTHLLDKHLDIKNIEIINNFLEPDKNANKDEKNQIKSDEKNQTKSDEKPDTEIPNVSKLMDPEIENKNNKVTSRETISIDNFNKEKSESESSDDEESDCEKKRAIKKKKRSKLRKFALDKAEILENFIEIDDGNYFCKICNRSARRYKLTQHLQSHDNSRYKYQCNICLKLFISETSLKLHHKNYHDNEKPYKCPMKDCNKTFVEEKRLKTHLKYHGERPFKCLICSKAFLFKTKLQQHSLTHSKESKRGRPIVQEKSSVNLTNSENRDSENTGEKQCNIIESESNIEISNTTEMKKLSGSENRESENTGKEKCNITESESNIEISNTEMKKLSGSESRDSDNTGEEQYNISEAESNIEISSGTEMKKLSGTRFKQTQMIRIKKPKTRIVKRNTFKVICETCGKSISKYKLPQHIRTHDDTRYQFRCQKCKKCFISEKSLQNHNKAIHTKELPFQCSWIGCTKRFIDQSALKAHMIRHTSDRPFKCEVCSKGFIYETKRDYHYKIYHVNGRIFRCEICNKGFYEQHNLNKHKIIHSTERPYSCDQCPAKFLRERCLQWHIKQHSGVKDYTCKICGKQYALYNGIYSHMKTHGIKYSLDYEKGLTDGKCNTKLEKE